MFFLTTTIFDDKFQQTQGENRLPKQAKLLLSFFSSVKLTIVLLVLIVLVFILATFLPQHPDVQELGRKISPAGAEIFLSLRLFDLYHSPLFYILMSLLSLNLITCSVSRFPASLKQFRTSCFPEPPGTFDNIASDHIALLDGEKYAVGKIVESSIRNKCGTFKKTETERGTIFYSERGRFSLFGVYVVHLSILLMIAGAIAGSLFGFEADVNIKEGESVDSVIIAGSKDIRRLDFSVRCDKFTVEFYENGAPKTYRSDLSFIRNNHVEHKGALLVNHPLTFADLRFYQTSYGELPDIKASLTYSIAGRKSAEIFIREGDQFFIPEQKVGVEVLRVEENIMQLGPAVKLKVSAPGKDLQFWIFRHIKEIAAANPGLFSKVPVFNPGLFKPVVFSLEHTEQQYFTGLHIVKDPGVPFVAVSGALMVAGLLIVFFMPHRRIWIRMEHSGTKLVITASGRSSRNQAGWERLITELVQFIREKAT